MSFGLVRSADSYLFRGIPIKIRVILSKFFKIAMLHVVLDWQKIYKIVLEKAFIFILCCFYLFFSAYVEKFEK
jgi:hypothetical protein